MSTTATKSLEYKVQWDGLGSLVLTQEHFRIERNCFGHICQCPRTFDDFDRYYRAKAFFSCTVVDSGRVLAFKVIERITSLQYHSFVTAVEVFRRRQGIARQMSTALRPYLEKAGASYLTKFCMPQAAALEFEDAQFVLISQEPQLTDAEPTLLSNLKAQWQLSRITISRVQHDYYNLAKGGTDDAIFKAYRLRNKPTAATLDTVHSSVVSGSSRRARGSVPWAQPDSSQQQRVTVRCN